LNPKEEIEAVGGQLDGALVADGKPHRCSAKGDEPGQPPSHYLMSPNGDGFFAAWSPPRLVVWYGPGRSKRGAQ